MMTVTAKKSFEIRTACDYLEDLLRPSYEEFKVDSLSSRKAIVCSIFAWHLHDWVWAQDKDYLRVKLKLKDDNKFDDFLFEQCPEMVIIQEIANGSKHFKSDKKAITETNISHGYATGLPIPITQSHLIVETTNQTYFAESLLDAALNFWDDFFTKQMSK